MSLLKAKRHATGMGCMWVTAVFSRLRKHKGKWLRPKWNVWVWKDCILQRSESVTYFKAHAWSLMIHMTHSHHTISQVYWCRPIPFNMSNIFALAGLPPEPYNCKKGSIWNINPFTQGDFSPICWFKLRSCKCLTTLSSELQWYASQI